MQVLDDMIYTCRTCLGLGTSKKLTACLSYFIKTDNPTRKRVKYIDVLVQIVPQMKSTVFNSDRICLRCRRYLKLANDFISQCLDVEEQLQESLNEQTLSLESEESKKEEVICDVQEDIILEDENTTLQEDLKLTSVLDDHSYIKTEEKRKRKKKEKSPSQSAVPKTKDSPEKKICEICGKIFKSSNYLRSHMNLHRDEQLKCPHCPRVFKCKRYLRKHQQVHVKDGNCQFMCAECGKLFRYKSTMVKHTLWVHRKIKPFPCEICDRRFKRADHLRLHLRNHLKWSQTAEAIKTEPSENADTTSETGETQTIQKEVFRPPPRGKYNILKTRVPDEMLPCKICGKFYKGFDKLKMHLERHAIVKRYGCRYCPMTYKLYSTLKKHEQWHKEEDGILLRCNVCWRRFTEQVDLDNHMEMRHSNPRYECSYCDEKFHRKYLMDNHILVEHATPEDVELSHKTVVYDTLVELAEQSST